MGEVCSLFAKMIGCEARDKLSSRVFKERMRAPVLGMRRTNTLLFLTVFIFCMLRRTTGLSFGLPDFAANVVQEVCV